MLGWTEILVVLLLALLLFGGKKLPELARSLGEGIREFKKASQDFTSEVEQKPAEKKSEVSTGEQEI
ncbi:MAG: twin-arginine translocase TatA/TatE family subunit [Waddliaceae bacterium]|nr:twin-arginine translocase TatA/TatE family subunit [Waddliaceae bacterium]